VTFEQALIVALSTLSTVIGILWKLHLDADNRERTRADAREAKLEAQLDKAEELASVAVTGWREQTAASAKAAEATEQAATAISTIARQRAKVGRT